MAAHVCPPILGYWLLNPLRKVFDDPAGLFGPLVQEGMTVLEPGPGMGYYSLELARRVGPQGRLVAVDIQPKMLSVLEKRARKAGLLGRMELRLASGASLGIGDLAGKIDLAVALYVVHEVPDAGLFFREIFAALKPGGKLLVTEPRGHVSEADFSKSLSLAQEAGFSRLPFSGKVRGRGALVAKT